MNRLQFWILFAGSCVVVIFLFLQILFARGDQYAQARLAQAQQIVSQGHAFDTRTRQLASRIYQLSQQTQDQGLKDLLVREHISVSGPPAENSGIEPAATTNPTTR